LSWTGDRLQTLVNEPIRLAQFERRALLSTGSFILDEASNETVAGGLVLGAAA